MSSLTPDFLIEKGVPIGAPRFTKYPFGNMILGDSFVSSGDPNNLRSAAGQFAKRNPKLKIKFSIRKIQGVDNQYRCWRVE